MEMCETKKLLCSVIESIVISSNDKCFQLVTILVLFRSWLKEIWNSKRTYLFNYPSEGQDPWLR